MSMISEHNEFKLTVSLGASSSSESDVGRGTTAGSITG